MHSLFFFLSIFCADLTKGESVTEEHPPPRRREFDEYIQLWDPTKSNDTK